MVQAIRHTRRSRTQVAVSTAADIMASAKEKNVQPTSTMSFQSMVQEVVHLRRENAMLVKESQLRHDKIDAHTDLLLGLFRDLGKDIPPEQLQRLSVVEANLTGSSHAGSDSATRMCHDAFQGTMCGTNSLPSENHDTNQ